MKILHTDFFNVIDEFEENQFDLIILDPDYQDWGSFLDKGIIQKSVRALKPDGNLICFTKQPFDYDLRIAVEPYFRREIIWSFDNGGAWCSSKMPLISFQKIYWCVKSKDFFFNPRTGIEYSGNTREFKRSSKVFGDYKAEGKQFQKSEDGIWLRDHLHYQKPHAGKIPAKPKELIEILIRCFCKPDGLILDGFAGSGIVEKIAFQNNFEFVAVEINEDRCMNIIDKLSRLRKEGKQNV